MPPLTKREFDLLFVFKCVSLSYLSPKSDNVQVLTEPYISDILFNLFIS